MKGKPIQPKLRLKDRRRRLMWIKVAAGSSVVVVLLVLMFYVSRLPSLTIAAIEVTGAETVDPDSVRSIAEGRLGGTYWHMIPEANVVFAPRSGIIRNVLAAFPELRDVRISHPDLTTLKIELRERSPVALWCDGEGTCYLMGEEGFVYRTTDASDSYVRYLGRLEGEPIRQEFLNGGFPALHEFVTETGKTVGLTPGTVSIEPNNDATISFVGGGELKFVITEDARATLENIASVFASQRFKGDPGFEYADFRYGNKVYVKFKGE